MFDFCFLAPLGVSSTQMSLELFKFQPFFSRSLDIFHIFRGLDTISGSTEIESFLEHSGKISASQHASDFIEYLPLAGTLVLDQRRSGGLVQLCGQPTRTSLQRVRGPCCGALTVLTQLTSRSDAKQRQRRKRRKIPRGRKELKKKHFLAYKKASCILNSVDIF